MKEPKRDIMRNRENETFFGSANVNFQCIALLSSSEKKLYPSCAVDGGLPFHARQFGFVFIGRLNVLRFLFGTLTLFVKGRIGFRRFIAAVRLAPVHMLVAGCTRVLPGRGWAATTSDSIAGSISYLVIASRNDRSQRQWVKTCVLSWRFA